MLTCYQVGESLAKLRAEKHKQTFLSGALYVNNSYITFKSVQFIPRQRHSERLDPTHYFTMDNLESPTK